MSGCDSTQLLIGLFIKDVDCTPESTMNSTGIVFSLMVHRGSLFLLLFAIATWSRGGWHSRQSNRSDYSGYPQFPPFGSVWHWPVSNVSACCFGTLSQNDLLCRTLSILSGHRESPFLCLLFPPQKKQLFPFFVLSLGPMWLLE